MSTIAKITRAYIRRYRDNGQTTAYVEYIDGRGKSGRIEGSETCICCGLKGFGAHMLALLARAEREGIAIERETW